MEVVGIVRTPLDTNDFKKQHQVNVIVHGDVSIRNNSSETWYPNQKLIAILPSPKLEENIRFEEFPEHAFYPIVEPFDCEKHIRYIIDLVYECLMDNNPKNDYPKWIQDIAENSGNWILKKDWYSTKSK